MYNYQFTIRGRPSLSGRGREGKTFTTHFPTIVPLYALYNTLVSARGAYHTENLSDQSLIMSSRPIMREKIYLLTASTMESVYHGRPAVTTESAEIHTIVIQRSWRWSDIGWFSSYDYDDTWAEEEVKLTMHNEQSTIYSEFILFCKRSHNIANK